MKGHARRAVYRLCLTKHTSMRFAMSVTRTEVFSSSQDLPTRGEGSLPVSVTELDTHPDKCGRRADAASGGAPTSVRYSLGTSCSLRRYRRPCSHHPLFCRHYRRRLLRRLPRLSPSLPSQPLRNSLHLRLLLRATSAAHARQMALAPLSTWVQRSTETSMGP